LHPHSAFRNYARQRVDDIIWMAHSRRYAEMAMAPSTKLAAIEQNKSKILKNIGAHNVVFGRRMSNGVIY
jgi:trimethylamine:corrinoid methyltransferase-like protein